MKQQVIEFFNDHRHKPKSFIIIGLKKKGISRSTIYRVLKTIQDGSVYNQPKASGCPKIQFSKDQKRKLMRLVDGKVAPSLRSLAAKFGHHHSVTKRILHEMNLVKKSRTQKPKVSPAQAERQMERLARALNPRTGSLRRRPGHFIVMDDETYTGLSRHSTASYYYQGRKEVPESVKFKKKEKFEPKLMCWAAISAKGISHLVIFEERTFMDTSLYIAIISTYLILFLEEYHSDGKFIFWPDLAPSHYASATLAKLDDLGIPYAPKNENPPAAPEIRPIERFWAHLKAKVYLDSWEA